MDWSIVITALVSVVATWASRKLGIPNPLHPDPKPAPKPAPSPDAPAPAPSPDAPPALDLAALLSALLLALFQARVGGKGLPPALKVAVPFLREELDKLDAPAK